MGRSLRGPHSLLFVQIDKWKVVNIEPGYESIRLNDQELDNLIIAYIELTLN